LIISERVQYAQNPSLPSLYSMFSKPVIGSLAVVKSAIRKYLWNLYASFYNCL